jgi:hypothetical protein
MNSIAKNALATANGDTRAAIDALCDGQYLADAGYTAADQTEIECAVDELKKTL